MSSTFQPRIRQATAVRESNAPIPLAAEVGVVVEVRGRL